MAAIATRAASHHLGAERASRANPPVDAKKPVIKPEAPSNPASKTTDTNGTGTDTKPSTNADSAAPLAPPPKPAQPGQSGNDGGDYFSSNHQGNNQSYTSEQNLFESAFAKLPETPGGTQLPPVASLTSPAGQLTGTSTGGFNWGNGSLRSGPLSPAMLSGPAGEDYFSTSARIGAGFPTPNESSLRTGLTPGGGGSMFPPAPSPNTQSLFNQLGAGFATPSTLDFHRTAMNANKKADAFTSAAPAAQTTTAAAATDSNAPATTNAQPFDQHEAANGLFMLAQAGEQGGNFAQNQHDAKRPARANNGSISNVSEITQGRDSAPSEEAEQKPNTRNKGKKAANGKNARKAEETPPKQPAKKKGKANNGSAQSLNQFDDDDMMDSDDDMKDEDGLDGKDTKKMTDEEKRKNFLERNRVAALKCRQRKKQWLANLQAKVEIFSSENDALSAQVTQLREEVLNLKTILIAHKDCPIAQQQAAVGQYIPTHGPDYGAHGNPYGNFQQPGQVPMGAGGPRRYS